MRFWMIAATALAAGGYLSAEPAETHGRARADTLHVTVGSPQVNGRVYRPHVGRVIKLLIDGDRTDTTAIWTNTLQLGDSAGREVHRWHTAGWSQPPGGKRSRFDLWSTFDAATLALVGWHLESATGAGARLAIDGPVVRGTLRKPGEPTARPVEFTLPQAGFAAGAADLIPYALGLREGLTITMPLWTPPGEKLETQIWTVTGRDSVMLDGRRLPSWMMEHFVRGNSRVQGRIWFVDQPPYVVRWELFHDDGKVTRMIGERGSRASGLP